MSSATVLASALLALPIVALYGAMGILLLRRMRSTGARPFGLFALFWGGVGLYGLAEASWILAYLAGAHGMGLALAVLHVKVVASVAGFFGLVAYVTLLLGGRRASLAALGVFYGALLVAAEAFYLWKGPVGQQIGLWGMRLEYAQTSVEPWWTLLLLALFVPPIVASLAYASLVRVAREPPVRRRIVLLAAALLGFFTPVLFGWLNGNLPWWGPVEKGLGLLTALAGFYALGQSQEEAQRAADAARERARRAVERDLALRARARDLV